MAVRPVGRLLWQSCVQTTASVSVYGVYALTNAWFVGHGPGDRAMAADNLVAPMLFLLGAVSTTVGAGGASLVSRALGSDPKAASRAAGNTFALYWSTAIVTTVVGLTFLDPLLNWLGARGALHGDAHQYASILLCGAVVSTGFSSLVRAEGRIGFSTMQWLVTIVVQITLDPILIFGLHLGVRGAALGSVGGQSISAVMSLWFFFVQRDRPYRVRLADLRPDPAVIRALVGIGLPSLLAGLGLTLLAVLVNHSLANAGAVTALAAYAVCSRLQTFAFMPHMGISQGMQPIAGYNTGRGLTERASRVFTLALRASLLYGLAAATLLMVLAPALVGLFLRDATTAHTAQHALRIIAIGQTVTGLAPLTAAYFQALGRPRPAYVLTIGTLLVVKVPLVAVFGALWGAEGIWVSLAAGEVVTAACALLLLRRLRRSRV
jgi:putative MATE family efflux protein